MSSQPLSSGFPQPSQPSISMMPAASLALLIDRLSQEHGLDDGARQKLNLFAIQANPSADSLWLYAMALGHGRMFSEVTTLFNTIVEEIGGIRQLVRHEWQLTKGQGDAIKFTQKTLIVETTITFRDLADRTKEYVAQYPLQFSLPMYNTDNAVAAKVNQFIEKDAHQVRGSFRKLIFACAVGTRPLDVAARRIAVLYSNEMNAGPLPVAFKAHIAQLRAIAFDIIQAAPAPDSGVKRPKADTGFWQAVDEKFNELAAKYGKNYDTGNGWRDWELDIIAQDELKFDGATQYFDQATVSLHAPPPFTTGFT
ncbi:hypothetical protein FRC12_010651 [Ceratobasidium sp. 428]|nr:hypothetical protein FRC12_010651 [Ceratobasidium sp. 428]